MPAPPSQRSPDARASGTPLLRGKYVVRERIGAGAMAAVFAGQHVGTERPVAIKRLLPDRAADESARARFEREARAVGRIASPHVVQVLDIDRDEDGAPFIVLERLFGETLADRLRRRPHLDVAGAIEIARQILAGVAAMHRAGVVHRDLKPSNVFLGDGHGSPVVKLVDFGVSKIHEEIPAEITQLGEMVGTFSFMPPEQIQKSAHVGPAADLWAVGILLYRMLSGQNPFSAGDPVSLVATILEGAPPPLPPECSALEVVISRALRKDPAERYPSAEAMAADLEVAARSMSVPGAAPAAPASLPASAVPAFDAPTEITDDAPTQLSLPAVATMRPPPPPRPSARAGMALAATVALAALLGAALGWVTAAPATGPTPAAGDAFVAIRSEPPGATITIAGAPVADPMHVPAAAGARAEVSAPGYATRSVALPELPGSILIVRLRSDRVASVEGSASAAPPAPAVPESTAPTSGSPRRIAPPLRRGAPAASVAPSPARPPVIQTAPY